MRAIAEAWCDADPASCRRLWCAVLEQALADVFGARKNHGTCRRAASGGRQSPFCCTPKASGRRPGNWFAAWRELTSTGSIASSRPRQRSLHIGISSYKLVMDTERTGWNPRLKHRRGRRPRRTNTVRRKNPKFYSGGKHGAELAAADLAQQRESDGRPSPEPKSSRSDRFGTRRCSYPTASGGGISGLSGTARAGVERACGGFRYRARDAGRDTGTAEKRLTIGGKACPETPGML